MNLVNLFSDSAGGCCKPAYNAGSAPPLSGKFYSHVLKRWLLYLGSVLLGLCLVGALLGALVLALLWPTLPSLEALTDYQPKVPLRVVSAEGDLLGEFGEERRADRRHQGGPGCHETGYFGRRRRTFLSARRCGLFERRPRGAGQCRHRDAAGRRHHHHAGRPQFLPHPRKDRHAQAARGPARLEDRGQPVQGRDPRAVRQPDIPRPAGLRLRRGVPDLLRPAAEGRDGARSRDARGPAQGAVGVQPGHEPEARQDPAAVCIAAYA